MYGTFIQIMTVVIHYKFNGMQEKQDLKRKCHSNKVYYILNGHWRTYSKTNEMSMK